MPTLANLRLAPRLYILVGTLLAGTVLSLSYLADRQAMRIVERAETAELAALYANVEAQVTQEARLAQAMAHLVAGMEPAQAALASGNREALEELLLPPYPS